MGDIEKLQTSVDECRKLLVKLNDTLLPRQEPSQWLTLREAAEFLHLKNPVSLRNKVYNHTMPCRKHPRSGRLLFSRSVLEAYRDGTPFDTLSEEADARLLDFKHS